MSKIVKGIGKIFKKVVKTVVKIAPFALAAAAVVFTGGAALGLGGIFAGGFAGAVGSAVGALGLSGAAAGALTGAITSAGFGAAIGGVLGGTKGLKRGALMGALTGGVLGAVSPATFGIKAATSAAQATSGSTGALASETGQGILSGGTGGAGAAASPVASGIQSGALKAAQVMATQTGVPAAATTAAAAAPAAASGGALGFLNSNPVLASGALQAVGGALSGGGTNYSKQARAQIEVEDAAARRAAANYAFPGTGLLAAPEDITQRYDPSARFVPGNAAYTPPAPMVGTTGAATTGSYRFNEETGQVEFVQPVRSA